MEEIGHQRAIVVYLQEHYDSFHRPLSTVSFSSYSWTGNTGFWLMLLMNAQSGCQKTKGHPELV